MLLSVFLSLSHICTAKACSCSNGYSKQTDNKVVESFNHKEIENDENSCGENLSFTLLEGNLTIFGTGAMYNYSYKNSAKWINNLETIT